MTRKPLLLVALAALMLPLMLALLVYVDSVQAQSSQPTNDGRITVLYGDPPGDISRWIEPDGRVCTFVKSFNAGGLDCD